MIGCATFHAGLWFCLVRKQGWGGGGGIMDGGVAFYSVNDAFAEEV